MNFSKSITLNVHYIYHFIPLFYEFLTNVWNIFYTNTLFEFVSGISMLGEQLFISRIFCIVD